MKALVKGIEVAEEEVVVEEEENELEKLEE